MAKTYTPSGNVYLDHPERWDGEVFMGTARNLATGFHPGVYVSTRKGRKPAGNQPVFVQA